MSEDRNSAHGADDEDFELEDEEVEVEAQDADGTAPEGEDGQRDAGEADERPGERPREPQEAADGQDARRLAPRESRAQRQARHYREQLTAERSRAAALQAQVDQIISRQTQEQAQAAERQFAEQLQMLPPDQVGPAILQRVRAESQGQLQSVVQQLREDNDRTRFADAIERNPKLAAFAERVEELKRQAPGVPRDILLTQALGEVMRRNLTRQVTRQTNAAAARVAAARTSAPASGRGDQPAQRQRTGNTPESRLLGVPI